jgi:predicted transcriptional regulator
MDLRDQLIGGRADRMVGDAGLRRALRHTNLPLVLLRTAGRAPRLSYRLYYHGTMVQREKRSVSLPPDLAKAVERAARAEGTTFSAWLAEAAAHRLKLEQGRQAIAEWEQENGPLTEAELANGRARARSSLGRAPASPPSPADRQSA